MLQHDASRASAERQPLRRTHGWPGWQRRRLSAGLPAVRCAVGAALPPCATICSPASAKAMKVSTSAGAYSTSTCEAEAGAQTNSANCRKTGDCNFSAGYQAWGRLPAGNDSMPAAAGKRAPARERRRRRRTFCGGGRLRSPEQEQWLHRACQWPAAPAKRAAERSGRADGAPKDPTTPLRPCKPAAPVHMVVRLTGG